MMEHAWKPLKLAKITAFCGDNHVGGGVRLESWQMDCRRYDRA
jgi:hypothetical protein